MLVNDYFAPEALFEPYFSRRFRMRRQVFSHNYHVVRAYDNYFILKKDVVGTIGFSGYQKCTTAMRMLAYGMPAYSWDEYL